LRGCLRERGGSESEHGRAQGDTNSVGHPVIISESRRRNPGFSGSGSPEILLGLEIEDERGSCSH
jgi:hypothetical protein